MKKKKQKAEQNAPGLIDGMTVEKREALNLMAYDPGEQCLDLTKGEKVRTTALLMAINYVRETICQDAEMYRAIRQDGKDLIPASVPHIINCSINFENFLLGRYSGPVQDPANKAEDARPQPSTEQPAETTDEPAT